jgi:hypothetical protein
MNTVLDSNTAEIALIVYRQIILNLKKAKNFRLPHLIICLNSR